MSYTRVGGNSWVLVGYYTDSYKEEAFKLVRSIEILNIDFSIERVDDLGTWQKNTQYKPRHLRKFIDSTDKDIVYVDCDAVFTKTPVLFDELRDYDLAFHTFSRCRTGRKEVLSGTIFIRNNKNGRDVLDKWIEICDSEPELWDQQCLDIVSQKMDNLKIYDLPIEYCCIFDCQKAKEVDPVIIHYQASRRLRK